MPKDPDLSYKNKNGKRVTGTAATLHFIYTEMGGLANYDDLVSKTSIEKWVADHSDQMQNEISRKAKKSRFKKAL